jgi:Ni,Fe-hydrogenase III large subunit
MKEEKFKVIIRYYKEQYTIEKKIEALRYSDAVMLAESIYGDGGNNVTITVI